LVLLGKQGAGKGTQAGRLADNYGVVHLSTGEIFRAQATLGTAFGLEAKRYMDSGELVPDEIVVGVIEESMVSGGPLGGGFVLDGFPRTLHQARELDRVIAGAPLHLVIDLDVPRELVLERLSARRVCRDCGTNYVARGRERQPWICDVCGGDVMHRDDDTPDAINHRLDLYEQQTEPLIEFYGETGRLSVVDGCATPDEVFARMTDAVDKSRSRG
jgi:adenylate kinase